MKQLIIVLCAIFLCSCNDTGPVSPTISQTFRWTIPNYSATLTVPPGIFDAAYVNNESSLSGLTADSKFDIRFFGPQVPGDFAASRFVLYTNNKYFVQTAPFNMTITISNYGGPGDYIVGGFSGTVRDSSSTTTFPVSGDFRIRN